MNPLEHQKMVKSYVVKVRIKALAKCVMRLNSLSLSQCVATRD